MYMCHYNDNKNKQNIWSAEVLEHYNTHHIAIPDVISHFVEMFSSYTQWGKWDSVVKNLSFKLDMDINH